MPRRAVQATTRRRDLRLSPELGEAQRRTDGSNRSRPPAPEDRRLKIRSSPSMQAPWSPRRGRELSRASLGEARRRQSRTGHGRTRHEGRPRVLRPIHRSLRVVPFRGVDISRRKPFLIIGVASRRRPRARYVAGPQSPAKRGGKILLRGARSDARARRSGLPPAIRAERALRPAHPQKGTGTSAASTSAFERPVASEPSGKGGRASSSRSRKCAGRSAMRGIRRARLGLAFLARLPQPHPN
jgi:hypothetical protein